MTKKTISKIIAYILITFKLNSSTEQNLIISFGEHLKDGTIRKIIENRNFSFEYFAIFDFSFLYFPYIAVLPESNLT